MISDLDCALFSYASYFQTKIFDRALNVSGVKVFVKETPDEQLILFPGSESLLDWWRDFEARMVTVPDLGGVEQGFMTGMRDVFKALQPFTKPIRIVGHSLGATRALIFGALMCLVGIKPETIIALEPPRPGGQRLKEILAPVTIRAYRNGNDPVCDVPPESMGYVHPREPLQVYCEPVALDPAGPMRWHHIQIAALAVALQGGFNAGQLNT
jgi:hypothetical protein